MARTADPRTTAQRGLGWDHVKARRLLVARLRDGDPCARCMARGVFHPMYRAYSRLLDVDDFPGRVFGGPQTKMLSWRHCNRAAGAVVGNKLRAARRQARGRYTRW